MSVEDEIVAATRRFYDALNVYFPCDLGPMNAMWLRDERVTTGRPIGTWAVGYAPVLESWAAMQSIFGQGGKVTLLDIKPRILSPIMGYALSTDHAELIAMGKPVVFTTRSTTIFRKEGGVWYAVHHHVDPAPNLQRAVSGE